MRFSHPPAEVVCTPETIADLSLQRDALTQALARP